MGVGDGVVFVTRQKEVALYSRPISSHPQVEGTSAESPNGASTALEERLRRILRDLWEPPPGTLPILDLARSLAIALVFCSHFGGEFQVSSFVVRTPFFYWGWTGVDLFFVLSGFLIGAQLWKEIQRTGSIRVARFLTKRGLRIWPLYFTFVGLTALGRLATGQPILPAWVDVLFLSNYLTGTIGGGWSLSTEEQFYIVAPVLIVVATKMRVPLRAMWAGVLILLAFVVGSRMYASWSGLPDETIRQKLYFPIHTHSDGLLIGVLIAWVSVCVPGILQSGPWRIRIPLIMTGLATAAYAVRPLVFNFLSLALIFGATVWLGVSTTVAPAFFRWRGFHVGSRLSYGVYLNHFALLPLLSRALLQWRLQHGEWAFWVCFVVSAATCLLAATVTFALVERPFLRLRERWLLQAPH